MVDMNESCLHVNHRTNLSWLDIDEGHRSANPKGNAQRIIIVHATTKKGSVIARSGARVERRNDFPRQKGGFHLTTESIVIGREMLTRGVEEVDGGET